MLNTIWFEIMQPKHLKTKAYVDFKSVSYAKIYTIQTEVGQGSLGIQF